MSSARLLTTALALSFVASGAPAYAQSPINLQDRSLMFLDDKTGAELKWTRSPSPGEVQRVFSLSTTGKPTDLYANVVYFSVGSAGTLTNCRIDQITQDSMAAREAVLSLTKSFSTTDSRVHHARL